MSDSYLRVTIAGRERIDWRIFFGFFPPPSKTLRSPSCRYPLLFAVPDLSMLLDQAKTQEKSARRKISRSMLREAPRSFDSAFPARSRFTTFCHQKVAPKVSAERKTRGPAPETLRGQARARVFDGASAARSSSRFFAMRNDCALRATMILIPFTRF